MKYSIMHIDNRAIENTKHNKGVLKDFEYVDLQYFDGIKGNAWDVLNHRRIPLDVWQPYDGRNTLPLPGEYGVWLSTIIFLEHVVHNQIDKMILLEDDVFLEDNFIENLSLCIKDLPDSFDFLSLYYFDGQNELTSETDIGSKYIHLSHNQYSAGQATLYSLKGAKKILNLIHRKGLEYTSDCFIFNQSILGLLDGYSIVPDSLSFLRHDNKKIKSLIDPNNIRLTE